MTCFGINNKKQTRLAWLLRIFRLHAPMLAAFAGLGSTVQVRPRMRETLNPKALKPPSLLASHEQICEGVAKRLPQPPKKGPETLNP